MNTVRESTKVVYVVVGKQRNRLGGRIKKLLSLRHMFEKMVLVSIGNMPSDAENIVVKPASNPTGFFRIIGLGGIKKKLDRYLFFPSVGVLYVYRMKKRVEQSIKNDLEHGKNICVITSVPRHDTCLIGLYLKKKYPDIYWIVDWRDLWSFDENYFERIPGIYRARLLKLEKEILNCCDMNVTTNKYAEAVLIDRYNVSHKNIMSINQSFSTDDFIDGTNSINNTFKFKKDEEIKIGFLGTLFKPPKVPGNKILQTISYVRENGINIKFHHYGVVPSSIKNSTDWMSDDDIIFHGQMKYNESLKEISQCDFLLLVLADLPNCRAIMHMKIPDYLLVKRPIIAIVPVPSAISDLIKKTNCGYVIPAHKNWGKGLESLMREIIAGADIPKRNEEEIKRYDWRNVSQQWFDLINNCESKMNTTR